MLNKDDLLDEERENVPLVQQLQSLYDTRTEDEQDLAFIREQLSQGSALPFERTLASNGTQRTDDVGHRYVRPKMPHRLINKRFWSVLAATLAVMLLTGSFLALFTLAPHQRTTRIAGGTFASSSATASKSQQTFGPDKVGIDSIRMFDEKRGWAQAYINNEARKPLLLRTIDGGQHWVSVTPDNIEQYPIVYFLDANTALVSSRLLMRTAKDRSNTYAEIYVTRDAGKTWQKSSSQITGKPHSFFFLNANEGWLLSVKESMGASFDNPLPMMLFQTKDGGRTWKQMPDMKLATASPGTELIFLNKTTGWLTKGVWLVQGNGKTIQMETYVTHDGGVSWYPLQLAGAKAMSLPDFFSAKDGVIRGIAGSGNNLSAKTYITHDGGYTWTQANWTFGFAHSILSPQQWRWINLPSKASAVLHITNDAGQHWTTLQAKGFKDPQGFIQLAFVTEKVGWILVATDLPLDEGKEAEPLYKTIDGGYTWTHVTYTVTGVSQ